jgi:hypothetical protein
MKKILVTTLVVLAIVAAFVLAARSFDLVGMLRRMHEH